MLKIIFTVLVVMPYLANSICPGLITRESWGARNPKSKTLLKSTPTYVVVHHSADGPTCTSPETCKTRVRNIQTYHMNHNKWSDIGYNFLIGGDGSTLEGRGWGVVGAHVPKYNYRSLGICLIGNFMNQRPSDEQLNALKNLIKCSQNDVKIVFNYRLIGHRQGGTTTCPGNQLFNEISRWPNFDSQPT